MSDWYYVKLRFTSPVRIGSPVRGVGVENVQSYLHSDTIFSALCNTWIKYGILTGNEVESLNHNHPFCFSSAFPFSLQRGETYFLPKPKLLLPDIDNLHETKENKDKLTAIFKKNSFIPGRYLKGYLNFSQQVSDEKGSYEEIANALNEYKSIYMEKLRVQHTQDRLTGASQIYHLGEIHFDKYRGGLYFIVRVDDPGWHSVFCDGLKALSRVGFGGERNFGQGNFVCDGKYGTLRKIEDFDEDLFFLTQPQTNGNWYCTLSLYFPNENEIESLKSGENYYDLVIKNGWTFSTSTLIQAKRKTIPFFAEGSLFDFDPKGKVEDVRPGNIPFPHPVWKWGIPLTTKI